MNSLRFPAAAPALPIGGLERSFVACGIVASALHAAMLVFIPMRWPEYSSFSQTVSELSAIGAPTSGLWLTLGTVYALLIIACGWGLVQSAGDRRPLRIAGIALIAMGILDLFWPPMHQRGTEFTLTDTLHIVFTAAVVLLMMTAIAGAAAAFGKRFRTYSAVTAVLILGFGTLVGMQGARIAANEPTPWVGVWQRINVGAWLLWLAVLSIVVLRQPKGVKS